MQQYIMGLFVNFPQIFPHYSPNLAEGNEKSSRQVGGGRGRFFENLW
jgi:hypothetical protein